MRCTARSTEMLTPDSGVARALLKNRRKRLQLLRIAFPILFIAFFYGNALSQENLPKLVDECGGHRHRL